LFKSLKWQASSQLEKYDISQLIAFNPSELDIICVAPDISSHNASPINKKSRDIKKPLQICFLSRISKMKNLDFALQVLTQVDIPIVFNIYGPIEDEAYWNKCKNIIKNMPNSVDVIFHDRIDPVYVTEKLAQNDLFFLPTLGENFGHVIAESLLAGTPVLISDQTPWRNLKNHGVGWDLPLNDPDSFRKAIVESANKSSEDYINWRSIVQKYGYDLSNDPKIENQNIDMFNSLIKK
jgi:glycosyltransferase involved in cell wall biosynthesis